jgi:2-succinyl-6-hydroxy-2,4-cyclohexadiene-1-carboxylate synthase
MTPLLLLHGFTGTPRAFDPFVALLSEAVPTLAPALIGHDGRDPGAIPDENSFFTECDRIAELAESLRSPYYVVGYSLGARIGLGIVARHARKVCGATLIAVHPGLPDPESRRERTLADEIWCAKLESGGIAAFVNDWESQPLFATQSDLPPDVLAAQRRERLAHDPKGLAYSLRATGLGKMPFLGAVLRSDVWGASPPVQLVVGSRDAKFASLAAPYASLPHRQVLVVEGAGHNVLLERPEIVAAAVERGARAAPSAD